MFHTLLRSVCTHSAVVSWMTVLLVFFGSKRGINKNKISINISDWYRPSTILLFENIGVCTEYFYLCITNINRRLTCHNNSWVTAKLGSSCREHWLDVWSVTHCQRGLERQQQCQSPHMQLVCPPVSSPGTFLSVSWSGNYCNMLIGIWF